MASAETTLRRGRPLLERYTTTDLEVLTDAEARRFVRREGDPQRNAELAWELLYRLEPRLYDRLAGAERLHPELLAWLPAGVERIVEVGAGTGRLTLALLDRAREVWAIEPAAPLRELLSQRLARTKHGARARVLSGFFDELPVASDFADLVVSCSAFTPDPGHGGDLGLAEMERVCRPGDCIALVWPNNLDWLSARGYRHVSFAGELFVEFSSPQEAIELTEIFYPRAAAAVRSAGRQRVPFSALGVNAPRDVAFKVIDA